MLRTPDSNNQNFGQAFGLTAQEDREIRLSILRKIGDERYTKFSDVLSAAVNEMSENTQPTLELIAVTSFYSGLYVGKLDSGKVMEVALERHALENMLG